MNIQGKPRVLLVEDEWLLAFTLEESVLDMGFDVVGPVPTVPQALDLIETQKIDLAILDVSLGAGQKSFPIAKALMARAIPFLFVSGYQESDLPIEFLSIPLCKKPYSDDALRGHLQNLRSAGAPNAS